MKNIKVLDCTLRDGGRIINCAFPDSETKELTYKLSNAKIDIVEIGFLRDSRNLKYSGNTTFFTDVAQISPFLNKDKRNTMYVAFIDYGLFDFTTLKSYDGTSIDGIRFGFTKRDYIDSYDDIVECMNTIKKKGYKLFVQGVNTLNYTDRELLEVVDMINEIQPYSFGIVDTYGAMYLDDVDRIYGLIDHNMKQDININFHSHNNYQLSFALAQEIIKLSYGNRQVIIDATLGGMGKVAGNLNTELIVDFLVRKYHYDYEFEDILDIIDDYIYKYSVDFKWGYSIPAMMAGIYKAHPNNIIYLTEKFRLETKDIGNLLSMIEPEKRQRYDYQNIERLYIEYIADKVEDYFAIQKLKEFIGDKEILVLVPGNTLNTHKKIIEEYIDTHDCFIICVNFIYDKKNESAAFFGNQKRYNIMKDKRANRMVIVSSNVKTDTDTDIIVNYHSIINRGYKYFENSTIMLLNLLKRLEVKKITIAGFDGFNTDKDNYWDASFQNNRHVDEFGILNTEIAIMFKEYRETMQEKCTIQMITPSILNERED